MLRNIIGVQVVFVVGSQQLESKYLAMGLKSESVKCHTQGKNAADFVLVCELTSRLLTGKYSAAYILSKDSGFDSVCEYITKKFKIRTIRCCDIDTVIPSGAASYCKYIINNFNSGVKLDKVVNSREGQEETSKRYLIGLMKMGLIRLKNDKIYFSKRNLDEASKQYVAQYKYLDEISKR